MADSKQAAHSADDDRRQYVNFAFYKVDPAWRRLPAEDRKRGKCQFIDAVKTFEPEMLVIPYSLVGIRGDCDFMLWRIGYELPKLQEMTAMLLATDLGKYLTTPYSLLAMTKRSTYVRDHKHPDQEGTRLRLTPGKFRYLFVYPFVKTRAWYRLTQAARQVRHVQGVGVDRARARHFGQGRGIRGQHRAAHGKGLQHGQAEALPKAGKGEDRRPLVEGL